MDDEDDAISMDDPSSIMIDLNELLRRDPTLSSLDDNSGFGKAGSGGANNINNNQQPLRFFGPGVVVPAAAAVAVRQLSLGQALAADDAGRLTADLKQEDVDDDVDVKPSRSTIVFDANVEVDDRFSPSPSSLWSTLDNSSNSQLMGILESLNPAAAQASSPSSPPLQPAAASSFGRQPVLGVVRHPGGHHDALQPTLTQLNALDSALYDPPAGSGALSGIKMEVGSTGVFEDLDNLFLTSDSANVNFGSSFGAASVRTSQKPVVVKHGGGGGLTGVSVSPLSSVGSSGSGIGIVVNNSMRLPASLVVMAPPSSSSPSSSGGGPSSVTLPPSVAVPVSSHNFWQQAANTEEVLFGSAGGASGGHGSLGIGQQQQQQQQQRVLWSPTCYSSPKAARGQQVSSPSPAAGLLVEDGGGAAGSQILSSSVPSTLFNSMSPLSDILSDLPSSSSVASGSPSPKGAAAAAGASPPGGASSSAPGPIRNSSLHRLLMQRKGESSGVGVSAAGGVGRPSPVRSPENRKTLDRIRNSLSMTNPMGGSQLLSRSAPTATTLAAVMAEGTSRASATTAGASGTGLLTAVGPAMVWTRREPRQHISSVCSVEASSIADEVNDVLLGLSPSDDLQDIISDDEDGDEFQDDKDTSDDDSDFEGSSPNVGKLSTSAGSSSGGGKKAERFFWQYNVQAKGPKGQKIVIETKIEDPHVLNEIVDPVFSGDVQLQGIKHSGKARRGDGNDLTPNPKKLAAIGKELDQLSRIINDLTPVNEMPFGVRCKSRKEKNKLASRACRLKKKAQHEANKVKCQGLLDEHRELSLAISKVKDLLIAKADPSYAESQQELTKELETTVSKALNMKVAGNTTDFVNKMIERNFPLL